MRTMNTNGRRDGLTRRRVSDQNEEYYTKQNEYGETQADIDAYFMAIDRNLKKGNGKLTGSVINN